MDDILVILLTLVVAIVGALTQRKKKREAQQPVPGTENDQTMDFWDLITGEEGHPDTLQPLAQEEQVSEEPVVEHRSETHAETEYSFSAASEGASEIKEKIKSVRPGITKSLIDGEEFSLRKAVIYSEILNRKYT